MVKAASAAPPVKPVDPQLLTAFKLAGGALPKNVKQVVLPELAPAPPPPDTPLPTSLLSGIKPKKAAATVPHYNVLTWNADPTKRAKGDYNPKNPATATDNTAAIQAAIDACTATGGVVDVPPGTYMTGMLQLKSNVTLNLQKGATIIGKQDDNAYKPLTPDPKTSKNNNQLSNCKKALIYAEGASNIKITGSGVIDGNAQSGPWTATDPKDPHYSETTRPMAIFTVGCTNVTYQNITVQNSAMWSLVNMEGKGLTISGCTVNSSNGRTRDGIDIVDCHGVLIENTKVGSQDDAICLKSGSQTGCDTVTVKGCHVLRSDVGNGLKLGTASVGPFTNIVFDTCDVSNVSKGAMSVESVGGSHISGVTYKGITVSNVGTPFFMVLGDRGLGGGVPGPVGTIDSVLFQNVKGDATGKIGAAWGSAISGTITDDGKGDKTTHTITNVVFDNVNLKWCTGGQKVVPPEPPEYARKQYPDANMWSHVPGWAFYLRHVSGVKFKKSSFLVKPADARQPYFTSDATAVTLPKS